MRRSRLKQRRKTLTKIGESTELKVKIEPENADAQKLIWKSDNEMVAAVDENGKVTAIGNGMAIITVTTGMEKNTASIIITVKILDKPVINKTKKGSDNKSPFCKPDENFHNLRMEVNLMVWTDVWYMETAATSTKTYKYKKALIITNGRTWTHKNLKKGTFYKYIVKSI